MADSYWSIDLSAGMELMSNSRSSPLIGERPSLGLQQHFSVNYAFDPEWGCYAGFGINYHETQRPRILDPSQIGLHTEDVVEALFGRFESIKPTFDAGIMYRLTMGKWEVLPKFGFSYTVNDWGRNREISLPNNGVKLHYKSKGAVPELQIGANGHYWLSTKGYLHVGLTMEHPLQKPYAEAIYLRSDEPMSSSKVKSTNLGQNLYLQVGYGFAFEG